MLVQLGQHGTFSQPLYMEASLVFLLFSPLLGLLPSFSPAKSKTLSEDPRTTLLVKLNFLQLWLSHHSLSRADSLLAAEEHLQQRSCPGRVLQWPCSSKVCPEYSQSAFSWHCLQPALSKSGPASWREMLLMGSCVSCASSAMPGRDQTLSPFHSSVGSSPEVSLLLPAVKAALAILTLLFCGSSGGRAGRAGHPLAQHSPGSPCPMPCTEPHSSPWQREFYTPVWLQH